MKVYLGSDKDGMKLKNHIKNYLIENGYEVVDKSEKESEDFVESAKLVSKEILKDKDSKGILFDLTGAGSFIAATKIKGIVCAEVSEERSAYMTCNHNDSRIITMGSGIVGEYLAENIVKEFLNAKYDGGRHQIRVDMLNSMC